MVCRFRFLIRRLFASAVLLAALWGLAGCYKHIVRAEGAGSGQYDIYEPNMKDEAVQDAAKSKTAPSKKAPAKTAPNKTAP
jgi:hypothetical protein